MRIRERLWRKSKWIALNTSIRLDGTAARIQAVITHRRLARPTILFYPEPLTIFTAFWKICQAADCRITADPSDPCTLAVFWDGRAVRAPGDVVLDVARRARVVNLHCRDFTKRAVSRTFAEVFGYDLTVDPRVYRGPCVRKSDGNGTHDGTVIECPTDQVADGYVYQRLVNNEVGGNLVEDLRVPVFMTRIPFVYLKYRSTSSRFSNDNASAQIGEADAHMTREEYTLIIEFCRRMGLEYGELDVLRDRNDRRLYIVDVNPTPFGPPNHMSRRDRRTAVARLARTFEETFLDATYMAVR